MGGDLGGTLAVFGGAVLACAAWIWNGRGDYRVASRVRPQRLEWEALDSARVVIAPLSATATAVGAEITVPPSTSENRCSWCQET